MQDGILESEDQENDVSNANSSCPEVKVLNKKRYQLNKIENRVVQMKTIIQKLKVARFELKMMKLILIERSQLGQKWLIYAMRVTPTQNVSITNVNVKMVSLVQDICALQCSASAMELINSRLKYRAR